MKEHEIIWPCQMCPQGTKKNGKVLTYSRKSNLVTHLAKVHRLPDPDARADKVQRAHKKNFFGCGFCIQIFGQINDQLNHIDNEHFKHHRHIRDWDPNNLLRGLLQQRDMGLFLQKSFQLTQPEFVTLTWDPQVSEILRVELEIGKEPVEYLAKRVIQHNQNYEVYLRCSDVNGVLGWDVPPRRIPDKLPAFQIQWQLIDMVRRCKERLEETPARKGSPSQNRDLPDWFYDDHLGTPLSPVTLDSLQPDESAQWASTQHIYSDSSISSATQSALHYDERDSKWDPTRTSRANWMGEFDIENTNVMSPSHVTTFPYFCDTTLTERQNRDESLSWAHLANREPAQDQGYNAISVGHPQSFRSEEQLSQYVLPSHYGSKDEVDIGFGPGPIRRTAKRNSIDQAAKQQH